MNNKHSGSSRQRWRNKALIYALIYLVLAGLWILLSGKALDFIVGLAEIRGDFEVYKGLLFVLLTSLALYGLLRSAQGEVSEYVEKDARGNANGSRVAAAQLPVAYLLGLVLIVASGGYIVFENLKRNETQKIEQSIFAVASLRAEQISGWLRQNTNFATAAGNGSYLASSFGELLRAGTLPESKATWVKKRLDSLRQSYPYGELALFDLNGKFYFGTGAKPPEVADHVPTLLQQAADSKRPMIGPMHWHERPDGTRYVSLPMATPLLPSGVSGYVAGVLLFELNPERNLFPLIESWPMQSKSAETTLFRRDGDDVVFLNELRHLKGGALTTLSMGANPTALAVRALKGEAGFIRGTDYRGVSVMSYVIKIPDADWILSCKVDTEEIEQPIRQIAINVTLTAFLLALVGGLSLFFWWRQRKAKYEAAQMKAELQQQALVRQVDYLSKYANDIVLMTDEAGIIIEANDRADSAYGIAGAGVVGHHVSSLRPPDEQDSFISNWSAVIQSSNMLFESRHMRSDGSVFPAEVSTRLIETDKGKFVRCIIRDISERKQVEAALRESEARFRLVAEEAPFPMQVHAEDGAILLINRAWTEITGYSLADIPTVSDWVEKACPECAPVALNNIEGNFINRGRRISEEYTIRCKDGSQRIWYFVSSPLARLEDGRRTVISMAVDVTERNKAEEDLHLAALVFESSHGSILITDAKANIVAVNPAFTQITGYSEQEVIGSNPRLLQSGRQGLEFYQAFWSALMQIGRWQGEIWNRRKNGEEYVAWLSVSALRDEKGAIRNYIGIADDITESKESQSRIEFLAYHDALTGLPNRLLANDRLEQAIAHAHRSKTRVAVMFLDLDNFKTINDTLGHSVGDTMLKAVAERLQHCLREADSVSRQGGDEFLVMLNDVADIDTINSVAVDILEKIHQPYRVEEHDLSISTSIGIAIYPEDGADCDTLLKNADMAMYNAKQSGRNTHRFFAEEMNDYVLEHLLIRNGLVRALENREFLLHYQPQLDLANGRLVGAEALIRWRHPELGMIPPNRFIQVAEESGMIIPIGNWVIQEACRQAMEWQKAGAHGLVVGVNISALQFRRGDMEQIVSAALANSGLAPQFLELELTESILIQDVEKSLDTIQRLKELGVRLSIDDFGTGYSSLAYLRRLPVDKLKIDQSFVRDITTRQDDAAIALSIITLAHTLKKKVIAEGVETVEQLQFMREHHCDEIQGYLLSRPLPPEGFADFLKRGVQMDLLLQG